MISMENIKRKKVLVRGRYDDDGGRYLLTEEQIAILRKLQEDGFIDDDIEIFAIEEEGSWETV